MNRQQFNRTIARQIENIRAERGCTHQALALEWLERFDPNRWKPPTVESHFSRLYKGRDVGFQFFFEDRRRGALLLDVLGFSPEDQERLLEYTTGEIESLGDGKALVVIDLTLFTIKQIKPCLRVLEAQLKAQPTLRPVHLIVRENQYEQVPRSWDDTVGASNIHRTEDAVAGEALVRSMATEGSLVAAPWRLDPFERWVALSIEDGALAFEPMDAFGIFARSGLLPGLPAVQQEVVSEPDEVSLKAARKAIVGLRGVELHRVMCWLATEPEIGQQPPIDLERTRWRRVTRVAMGLALDTPTAATLAERLGLELPVEDRARWRQRVDRATRRPYRASAAIVDGVLHLLNPTPGQEKIAGGRAQMVHVDVEPNAMEMITEETKDWTLFHFADDPYLVQLIDRLDPVGERRIEYLHARASLIWSSALRPAASTHVEDWRATLRALLSAQIPEVWVERKMDPWSLESYSYREGSSGSWLEGEQGIYAREWAERSMRAELVRRTTGAGDISQVVKLSPSWLSLVAVPPVGYARSRPGTRLTEIHATLSFDEPDDDLLYLPMKAKEAVDPARWADFYDCHMSPSDLAIRQVNWSVQDRHGIPAERFRLVLGAIWLALRAAVRSTDAVQLTENSWLMPIGNKYAAEIQAFHIPGLVVSPRVGIGWSDKPADAGNGNGASDWLQSIREAGEQSRLPQTLRFQSGEYAAEIHLHHSPLFALPAGPAEELHLDEIELDALEPLETFEDP